MKILLITFSGTGNTALCGEYIKEAFLNKGDNKVDHYIYNYDKPFDFDIDSYDLIGIGYPIHAFNAPKIVIKTLKLLPTGKSKNYFIYKVSGEPFKVNDASSYKFVKMLKKKNYFKIAEKHFLMPYNIIFRYKKEIAKQMYLYLKPLCYAYVDSIYKKDINLIKYNPFKVLHSTIFRIEWIAPNVNTLFRHSKKNCIHCNKCINTCPTHALYINKKNKIKATKDCILCMRCSYNCPVNAMNMGIVNFWVVNGPFNYEEIKADKNIVSNYINPDTKGYFKLFRKYFAKQDEYLAKYGYKVPLE